jgi:hypothetical protein
VQAPGAAGQTATSTASAATNGSGSTGTPPAGAAEPAGETRPPLGAGLPSIGGCVRAVQFDAGNFPATPDIDNPYLPFVPGTQLVLQGRSAVTGALEDHTVTFTVTDLVKTINGVSSLVIHDVDLSQGVKTEEELAFFAQDQAGNVWNLGEYPEEFDGGEFVGAPSTWIAGQQRAEAGIHMLAAPQVGGPRYLQGFVPRIRFFDCAQVIGAGQQVAVTGGTFDNVLVTDENNPLEPQGGSQQKYHAPGVGIVKVGFLDDPQAEELELVELNLLTPAELAVVRAAALALDTRAYDESAAVYEATSPARRL